MDEFRSPQLGDTIRTVEPMAIDTPMFNAGQYLRVTPVQAILAAWEWATKREGK